MEDFTYIIYPFFIIFLIFIIRYFNKKLNDLKTNQTISKKEYKFIYRLSYLYFIIHIPIALSRFLEYDRLFFGFEYILSMPIYLISAAIPVMIASLLFYRNYVNPYNKIILNKSESLEDSVNKIFNSNEFYNAISSVLPKGDKDKADGLDYIPYLLQNIQNKRKRFADSSSKFLVTTISLSVFLVITTIYFGYILVNQTSIGIYKDVKKLSEITDETNKTLSSLKLDLSDDNYLLKKNSSNFNELKSTYKFKLSENGEKFSNLTKKEIEDFEENGDFDVLTIKLKALEDSLTKNKTYRDTEYLKLLHKTNNSISDYVNKSSRNVTKIQLYHNEVNKIVSDINARLDLPINTTNELIKRLILSLVILTFFLSILRYFRNLYQKHHTEMLKAEEQDLKIRKFYVALMNSKENSDERKIVLVNFLSDSSIIGNSESSTLQKKTQNIENEMLRDVINSILKKI